VPDLMIELAVGDVLIVGDQTLTVIDVDGDEVSFRLDPAPPETAAPDGTSTSTEATSTEAAASGRLQVSVGSVRVANGPAAPRRAK
jgi:hypothetical protein